ncbi:hypothetical protein [Microbulbifer sediminum]|uniref:hypothetical protein n=1 Tax=Microbulbifer sediminum TaxID=2904250 RepID=UPI001F2DDE47|nr:hypothetical protein [Microbulbifer sediminum]
MKIFPRALLLLAILSSQAFAGPFTDEMSKCLVRETSDSDKTLFIQWLYAAMSSHPDVKNLANISPAQASQMNEDAAGLVMDLLADRCKDETAQAIKYEGKNAFETSFAVLGQVAMQGLMANQDVQGYLSGLEKHFDGERLASALAVE